MYLGIGYMEPVMRTSSAPSAPTRYVGGVGVAVPSARTAIYNYQRQNGGFEVTGAVIEAGGSTINDVYVVVSFNNERTALPAAEALAIFPDGRVAVDALLARANTRNPATGQTQAQRVQTNIAEQRVKADAADAAHAAYMRQMAPSPLDSVKSGWNNWVDNVSTGVKIATVAVPLLLIGGTIVLVRNLATGATVPKLRVGPLSLEKRSVI